MKKIILKFDNVDMELSTELDVEVTQTEDQIKICVPEKKDPVTDKEDKKKEKVEEENTKFNNIMHKDTPDDYDGFICGIEFPKDRNGRHFYTLKSFMCAKQFEVLNHKEFDDLERFEKSLSVVDKARIEEYINKRDTGQL